MRQRKLPPPRPFDLGLHDRRSRAVEALNTFVPMVEELYPSTSGHLHRALAHLELLKGAEHNKAYTAAFAKVTQELGYALQMQMPREK